MTKRFTDQDVLDEIDIYAEERGFSDSLRDLAKERYIEAQKEYKGVWQEWSVERHKEEARQELADLINYSVFARLLSRRKAKS